MSGYSLGQINVKKTDCLVVNEISGQVGWAINFQLCWLGKFLARTLNLLEL